MTKNLHGNCEHCGNLIEFPAEQAGETATCPHCRQETALHLAAPPEEKSPLKTRALVFVIIALVILIGGVIAAQLAINRAKRMTGQSAKPVSQTPPASPADPIAQAGFQVSPVTLEKTGGSSLVYAVGTVNDITNRKRFGVQIAIGLFDREGRPCGSAKDYQANLDAGGRWKFRALVIEKTAVSAKVISVKEGQ